MALQRKYENGQKVVDRLTGFTGVITAVVEYLNGCIRYQVQPPIDEKGLYRESVIIDEQQLDLVVEKQKSLMKKIKEREPPGGDRPAPKGFTLPKNKI
jgi:hypothetical protein